MTHEPTKKGIRIIERMLKVDKRKEEDEVIKGLRPAPQVLIHKDAGAKIELLTPRPGVAWGEPLIHRAMKVYKEFELLQRATTAAMLGLPLEDKDV